MRLLQVSLRSLMLYSLVLVLVSIPLSFFFIRGLLNEEMDESLAFRLDQFEQHIQHFETLEDISTDLSVMDRLIADIDIESAPNAIVGKRIFSTVNHYDSLEKEHTPYRQVSTGVQVQHKRYQLTIRTSLLDNDDLVEALVIVQAALAVLLTIGLILLNRSLTRKLWKPFYNTIDQLKAYELDKSGFITSDKTNILEFDDLNHAIYHLTERNRKIYLEQKEFIENASHELQTPLAVFQSKLDNLMQSAAITEKEAQEILELEGVVRKMSRLNKNLLLLSKIDNGQFAKMESVDVSRITNDLIENIDLVAQDDRIALVSSLQPLVITANGTLIEVLLTNLVQNAVRHCLMNGRVDVEIKDGTFRISNTGNPLKMDPARMFERFQKETGNATSTGIGLAIVKKICDSNGYDLEYNFYGGVHVFSISF